jgi:hypothetical protein
MTNQQQQLPSPFSGHPAHPEDPPPCYYFQAQQAVHWMLITLSTQLSPWHGQLMQSSMPGQKHIQGIRHHQLLAQCKANQSNKCNTKRITACHNSPWGQQLAALPNKM